MKSQRHEPRAINAGSMADIAFLLLIFFLVTASIPNDKGIYLKLPPPCLATDCVADLHKRNVLEIIIGKGDQMLVNGNVTEVNELQDLAIAFIDNNGNGECSYCKGTKALDWSAHPSYAVISVQSHPEANYRYYIQVQDKLVGAYYELRKTYLTHTLKTDFEKATERELALAREAYPLLISEAETQ